MKHLATITDKDIAVEVSVNTVEHRLRTAARAIVEDTEGKVALLAVTKHGYHKLPGGGIEEGEHTQVGLAREIREELGCEVVVTGEVGQITEYRDKEILRQESLCYRAKLKGEKGQPSFTQEELAEGFEVVWVDSVEVAIKLLESDITTDYNGKFILKRDITFLKEVL